MASIVWLILAAVVVLFALDRIRPEAVALAGLIALAATGALNARDALAGFSSPAVISIAALLVLSAALERTGVVRWMAERMHDAAGTHGRLARVITVVTPGLLSGFLHIVATVSVFIPVLLRLSLLRNIAPSRLLLPMAYVAMAGANLTLIGSSSNLVVNDILTTRTNQPLGFFEIMPIGLLLLALVTVYVLVFSRRLLPDREVPMPEEQTADLIGRYDIAGKVWEVEVMPGSPVIGSQVGALKLGVEFGLSLIAIVRKDRSRAQVTRTSVIEDGDTLLVGGRRERVERMANATAGLSLKGAPAERDEFSAGSGELIEVLVPPRSAAIGKTVRDLELRAKADLTAIALWRDGKPQRTDVPVTTLKAGDALLLYGEKRHTRGFDPEPDFLWLRRPRKETAPLALRRLAPWTVLIFIAVILTAAFGFMSISVAALAGALGVVLLGTMSARDAYARVDWQTVILVAAMLPFATALESSGASHALAAGIRDTVGGFGALAVMGMVALATLALTQVLHNAAAAAIMTPVALEVALQMGVSPRPYAIAVLIAASMAILLPVGHPAPLLVRNPGRYRVADYLRLGGGLVVPILIVILAGIPWLWPLDANK